MKFYTYIHTRADDLKVFYVGKGVGKRARSKAARNAFWNNTVAKHGYIVSICMRFATEVEAHEHEKFLIQCFRGMGAPLTNLTDGGEGTVGMVHSAQTRAKIAKSNTGKKQSQETLAQLSILRRGRRMSVEHKAKLLAANTGRVPSEATVSKLREINTGKRMSDEARAKMSAAGKGRKRSEAAKAKGAAAHLGRKNTPETIAKMSAAHKERGMTAENKAKLLAATIARTGAVASANAHKAWATRRAKAAACTA